MQKMNLKKIVLSLAVVVAVFGLVGCGEKIIEKEVKSEGVKIPTSETLENELVWYEVPELGIRFKVKSGSMEDLKYVAENLDGRGIERLAVYFYSNSAKNFVEKRSETKDNNLTAYSQFGISKISNEMQEKYEKEYGVALCSEKNVLLRVGNDTFCKSMPQATFFSSKEENDAYLESIKDKKLGLYLDTIEITEDK